jgi:ribonuclease HI
MSATAKSGHASHCVIYTDGGARGNPGPAAAGGVILADDGSVVAEISEYLGVATNNVAEYRALLLALQRALDAGFRQADVCMDSELIVRQLSGHYRVKDAKIIPLYAKARHLLARFDDVNITHVRREQNQLADKLVNAALDAVADKQRLHDLGS